MCGIAGFLDPDADPGRSGSPLLRRMCDKIRHRGPDSRGFHDDPPVGLGVQRLAIVDLETGDQPVANEDGSVWVAFNGEIYNHASLRRELSSLGHRFRTDHADTEVLAHAWEEWGEGFPERLNGMFACALWDAGARRLLLVRDRIGIKPLYYWWDGRRLVFASEIKAILEHPAVDREVDLQSLYDYLGWEFVPGPATMFRDIRKLMPGHHLLWEDGRIDTRQWWDIRYEPVEADPEEHAAGIRDRLIASVRRRLQADVPVGIFLSGGLDSTAVLAAARELVDGPLRTFTIGYADPSFSEWDHAAFAAEYFGTVHREIPIRPISPELIERCVWQLDEPMTDLSAMPLYVLCEAAREDVKVCLSGEGGDEVFVGYDRFVASKCDRVYRLVPGPIRRGLVAPLVSRLPDQEQKKGLINMVKRFVRGSELPVGPGAMRWQYFSSEARDRALFTDETRGRVETDRFAGLLRRVEGIDFPSALDRELYIDLRFTMPDSVLMKVDKMSMANSLEVRVPLLDHELVEYAARIPARQRFPGLRRRAIYRKAVAGLLPPRILDRGKQGYSLPIKNWLRHELRDWMVELLGASELIARHLQVDTVDRLIAEHLSRRHNHNHVLWALINLELWHRAYVQQEVRDPAGSLAT